MDSLDKELIAQLASSDPDVRLAAARTALQTGETKAAEHTHPLLNALTDYLATTRRSWIVGLKIRSALLVTCFLGFPATSTFFIRSSVGHSVLEAIAFSACIWIVFGISGFLAARDMEFLTQTRFKLKDTSGSEAHSLAAINGLSPLLLDNNDLDVQEAAAKSLDPVLPLLDPNIAACLTTDTIQALAKAAGNRDLPVRFRVTLLEALGRMTDYRAAAGVASALREGKWDIAIRDAASAALESIQANKRNSALLRPADAAESDSLLRPAANAEADSEHLLRVAPGDSPKNP